MLDIISIEPTIDGRHNVINILGLKLKFKRKSQKNRLWNDPWGLIIDTTLICNNNCSFCWRSSHKDYLKECNEKYDVKTMPLDIYKKIIDDAVQYDSITCLSLCGPMGEPLMNDNIEEFFEYAFNKHHFRRITINTNGLALNKRDIGRLLNSITEFSISVDTVDIDTYEKIHGNRCLDQVIENIKSLVDYKKKNGAVSEIFVRFTENEHNRGQFPQFKTFFEELGVDKINYTKEHSFAGVNKSLNNTNTAMLCFQPTEIINFNFKGELTTCCINWHLKPAFFNIKDHSIKELWESDEKLLWNNNRIDKTPCNDCSGLGTIVQKSQKHKPDEKFEALGVAEK